MPPMRAKKHLGQHFLTSKAVLRDMIAAANVGKSDTVLEIGPGKGVLTNALLKTGATVIAIETDQDMIDVLNEKFVDAITKKQLILIKGDVLDTPLSIETEYKLIANIPYYITGEIIRRFLSSENHPISMTLLVQKEVGERIARSTKETILSLSVKVYGGVRYVTTVPSRYFSPAPKVDSAVVHISDISKKSFEFITEEHFFKVVKAGFASKRKQLVNNLSAFGSKEKIVKTLSELGLHKNVRAEDVGLTDWIKLTKVL